MTTASATRMLESEHVIIAKVIGAVPILAARLEAGQTVDDDVLNGVVEFMRIFADRCHHGKEEGLLFQLLGKKGVPLQGCPIAVLTMEHARGRNLVKGLADAAAAFRQGKTEARNAMVEALKGLADLYPNHIWKEDYLLFPLTDKVLNADEQQELCRQFEEVEESIGAGTHHRLEQFADRLAGMIHHEGHEG